MLKGYGLTTAEILYHLPDHPHLIQSFVWQHFDLAPKFPALYGFIDFWKEKTRRAAAFGHLHASPADLGDGMAECERGS